MPTSPFVALRALLRAPRFLSREILTLPRRRLSASLPHHGPPPATPRPMTYHPRDNATAHGPRDNVPPPATRPRNDHVPPPAAYHPRDNVTPPATQLPRRSPDNVAGAPEPSSRRPHTPAPSPTHTATHLRTRPPPTQPSAVTHDRRSSPRTRHQRSDTPTATQHHTTSHGRPSKASGRHNPTPRHTNAATRGAEQSTIAPPSTTGPLGYTTTPRTTRPTRQDPTQCNQETRGCLSALPPSYRTNPHLTRRPANSQFLNLH